MSSVSNTSTTIGAEFTLFENEVPIEDALAACVGIGAQLARISNREEFNFVQTLAASRDVNDDFYIGLIDSAKAGVDVATRFDFVDGFADKSFFATQEQFPWGDNEPSNRGDRFCVTWRRPDDEWRSVDCTNGNFFLCRRDFVTSGNENDGSDSTKIIFAVALGFFVLIFLLFFATIRNESRQITRVKNEIEELDVIKNRLHEKYIVIL